MSEGFQDCDVPEEINKDWKKVERDLTKTGFRDGISDGKEQNFQKQFDEGFSEGFRNGFSIGLYKGALFANSSYSNTFVPNESSEEPLLSDPKKGWCQICTTSNQGEPISKIKQIQVSTSNKNLQFLSNSQASNCNITLPSKLE